MGAPAWRDERLSLLKSALQKSIRRGEVELAATVTARLLAMDGGRSALRRRLPVIAAEDVGAAWIPVATLDPEDDAVIPRVVAAMARAPKDKAAYWLAATVWEDRYQVARISRVRLERTLRSGDHRQAVALALAAKATRHWRSGERLIGALREAIATRGTEAVQVGEAALIREALGGSGEAELIAAAVIVAIDGLVSVPTAANEAPSPATITRLPWYVADGHTAAGQRALRRVARRHGLPSRGLTELMFSFESVRISPIEVPSQWASLARALDAEAYGWESHDHGARIWEAIRADVRDEVERELQSVEL